MFQGQRGLIVFGGSNSTSTLSDLWFMTLASSTGVTWQEWPDCVWQKISQVNPPQASFGPALTSGVFDGQAYLILYGGCGRKYSGMFLCDPALTLSRLQIARFEPSGLTWRILTQVGPTFLPPATWPNVEVFVATPRLLVYGGYAPNATTGSRASRLIQYGRAAWLGTWNTTHVVWEESDIKSGTPATFGGSVLVPLFDDTMAVVGAPLEGSVQVLQFSTKPFCRQSDASICSSSSGQETSLTHPRSYGASSP
jgi:hypothetical protein